MLCDTLVKECVDGCRGQDGKGGGHAAELDCPDKREAKRKADRREAVVRPEHTAATLISGAR